MPGGWFRRGLVTGLGVLWMTKEKAEELVAEWVQQGKVSMEQSRETVDKLLKVAEEQRHELTKVVNAQVAKAMDLAGLASHDELKALEERVAALERSHAAGDSESGSTAIHD